MKKWRQREFEFRAWDMDINAFLDSWYICHHPNQFLVTDVLTKEEFPNAIALQYTGVKDVNGKKIFEGDIVNISNKLCNPSTPDWVGYVEYDTNGAAFIISLREDKDQVTHVLVISPASEIIGNVFQNPELVEKYKLEI